MSADDARCSLHLLLLVEPACQAHMRIIASFPVAAFCCSVGAWWHVVVRLCGVHKRPPPCTSPLHLCRCAPVQQAGRQRGMADCTPQQVAQAADAAAQLAAARMPLWAARARHHHQHAQQQQPGATSSRPLGQRHGHVGRLAAGRRAAADEEPPGGADAAWHGQALQEAVSWLQRWHAAHQQLMRAAAARLSSQERLER